MTTATGKKSNARANRSDDARPSEKLSDEQLLQMLYDMMLIRRFEERAMQSYMQQKIGGFCHIYIGQEAVAVGTVATVRPDDPIITAYRDHGHALARGMHPDYCMAEMFGKITGCAKGKGGSMHMFDRPNEMYGGHAIVGGQCPLGVGLGFAIQYQKLDRVCLCYLGDGALNQAAFHEAMNLAAIWKLPVLFVLENNMYSMGTHIERGTSAAHDLSKKAAAYDMRYAECDGMSVTEVYDCFVDQVARARPVDGDPDNSEGPALINVVTYRYQGHSMSDPQKYRTREEVGEKQNEDPITTLSRQLMDQQRATQEQLNELDGKAKQAVRDAVKFAEQSPEPDMEELYTDVYNEPYPPYRKGDLPEMVKKAEGETSDSR